MRTNTVLRMCLSAILLMLVSSAGMAQGNSDAGQYRILQARYGTERRNVDVTSRLQEIARSRIAFRMDNATFGVDPDYGVQKVLRIYAQDERGQDRMFEYVEGSTVDGSMFSGWSRGNWGQTRTDGGGWNGPNANRNNESGQYEILQARYGTERRNVDVTSRLKELARQRIAFRMDNATFGVDPDYGVQKVLRIYTRDRSGRDRMFEYIEGNTIDGSIFTGWSSGNWGRGGRIDGWGVGNQNNQLSLNIMRATYGAGRQSRDVTDRVRSMVRDGRLSLTVDNNIMGGDPAPNVHKELRILFTSGGGREQEIRVSEGQQLTVP